MSETKETPKDIFAQWAEWQQNFWSEWMKGPTKGMEAAMSIWQPETRKEWFEQWQKNWLKTIEEGFGGIAPREGLGAEVFSRMFNAGKVYTDLLGFWTKAMMPLTQLQPGTELNSEKIKELHEQWLNDYKAMMESMWGAAPSPEMQEVAKSISSAAVTGSEYAWHAMEPLLKNLENLPQILEKASRGEAGAMTELSGIFRKSYEDTVGKALKAPSMGFFREIVDLFNRTVDAYIQFNTVLADYNSLFHATGQRAAEKVFERLSDFQGKEVTPETFREFYKIWWTINEDTYHEVFLSPEFTNLLQEVLRRGLILRKWVDELADEIIEGTNLPTKKDMDEIYKALYELKKEVRWQGRYIRQLEDHLGIKTGRTGRTAFTGQPLDDSDRKQD